MGDHAFVARELARFAEHARQPPGARMEPEQRAGDSRAKSEQPVGGANVRELVEQHHAPLLVDSTSQRRAAARPRDGGIPRSSRRSRRRRRTRALCAECQARVAHPAIVADHSGPTTRARRVHAAAPRIDATIVGSSTTSDARDVDDEQRGERRRREASRDFPRRVRTRRLAATAPSPARGRAPRAAPRGPTERPTPPSGAAAVARRTRRVSRRSPTATRAREPRRRIGGASQPGCGRDAENERRRAESHCRCSRSLGRSPTPSADCRPGFVIALYFPSARRRLTAVAICSRSSADSGRSDSSSSAATAAAREPLKNVPEQVSHGRSLRDAARRRREVHVARSVLLVAQVSLLLENPQQRSHRRRAGRVGKLTVDLRRRRPAALIHDVHDLSFAPTEIHRLRGVKGDGRGSRAKDKNLSLC